MAASLLRLLHAAAGTPYQDGSFRMKMVLGADFPRTPPKGMPQPCAYDTPEYSDMLSACGAQTLYCAAQTLYCPCLVPVHDLGHLGHAVPTRLQVACVTRHRVHSELPWLLCDTLLSCLF